MSKKKPTPGGRPKKKAAVSHVRSSAAEYLTFVAAGGDSEACVEMRYEDENIWLTQKMMAALYDVSIPANQPAPEAHFQRQRTGGVGSC